MLLNKNDSAKANSNFYGKRNPGKTNEIGSYKFLNNHFDRIVSKMTITNGLWPAWNRTKLNYLLQLRRTSQANSV